MYVVFPEIFSKNFNSSVINANVVIIGRVYDFSYDKRNVDFYGKIELYENKYIIRIDKNIFVNTNIQSDKPITVSVCPTINND
jgi:hypothetical protein